MGRTGNKNLKRMIREIIDQIDEPFTVHDIYPLLLDKYKYKNSGFSRVRISQILRGFKDVRKVGVGKCMRSGRWGDITVWEKIKKEE